MSRDPQFPNRPDHPDFWMLSAVVIDTDVQVDTGQSVDDVLSRFVDVDSVMYMAEQRALRAIPGTGPTHDALRTTFAAVWLDAFVAGVKFQHGKSTAIKDGQTRL